MKKKNCSSQTTVHYTKLRRTVFSCIKASKVMNTQLVGLTENWGTSVVKLNIQCEREPACSFIAGGRGVGGRKKLLSLF